MSQTPEPISPSRNQQRANAPVPEQVDVAIVGAGLGGLTAGAYLARKGLKVACFDAHYVAGGCATQFSRGPKSARYHFDVGLHYIGDCGADGAIPSILADVGVSLDFLPLDQEGFDELIFPDLRFRVPASIDVYRDRLVDVFPSERRGIDRYVDFVRQVGLIGRKVEKNDGRLSARIGLDVLLRGRLLARYQRATIKDLLDSCTQDPKLRAVMLGQNGDYGLPPSKVAAVLHAGLAEHYFRGAYYPRGGGQIIADRLAETIEAAGGSVHLRRPIERILVEDGRAVGVRTEARHGEVHEVRARAVLSNADIQRTMIDLVGPEHLPAAWTKRVESFEMAAAIFITFLGVRADMRAKGMRAANYWQFDSYDMEGLYSSARHADGPNPGAAYITSATMKEPDSPHHAPPGVTSLEVMTLLPGTAGYWGASDEQAVRWEYKRDEAYLALKRRVEDQMIERLEGIFPGTAESVVFRESATPLSHTRYTRATAGTGYGLAATPAQFLQGRPGYRGPLQGLYLCGASTRSGHGIVGAMLSGRQSSKRVAVDLGAA